MRVADFGNKFKEYTKNVVTVAQTIAREETEGVTDKMQKKAAAYKDLTVETRHQ